MVSAFRVHVALITVSLLFGGSYVFTKRLLVADPPVPAGAWVLFRILAATAILVPLALALRRRRPPSEPRRRVWPWLVVASFFGVGLNQVLFTEGMARTTPEHSAVVNACIPTWTLLVAVLSGQERLGLRRIVAILVALTGVFWLLGVDRLLFGDGAPSDGGRGASLLGDLLTMANGIAFAIHLVLLRKLRRDVDPWTATAIMFASGSLMISLWSAPQVTAASVDAVLTAPAVWYGLYVILFATVLTYLLNTWALQHAHSSQVALYINVQPIVAAALNSALGAPLPGHRFFMALALVAIGLWLQTSARS